MTNISVSLLNVTDELFSSFLEKITSIKKKYNMDISIHFDVMDNIFVPNTGIDIEKIKKVKEYGMYVDTHLMVEDPKEYIDSAIKYHSDDVTIHYEIPNFDSSLTYLLEKKKALNDNLRVGVAINPKTDISSIEKYIEKIDKVLVMSVEPGFGGQKYIDSVTKKISKLKDKYNDKIIIQVDGGINNETINYPLDAGVDSIVIGKYITENIESVEEKFEILNNILKKVKEK